MEEEAPVTEAQDSSTEDRIRSMGQTPTTEDRIRAIASTPDPAAAANFVINQGATRDPAKAARAIRISRRYGLPDTFAENNLDDLEAEEKKGALASEDLVNTNPRIAALAAKSPNWSATLAPNLPLLKKLEMMYQKDHSQWPRTEQEYGPEVTTQQTARAERDWAELQKNPYANGVDDYGRPIPVLYGNKEEMANAYVKAGMARRREEENYIGGIGPITAREAFERRVNDNLFFWAGFGTDAVDIANIMSLKDALTAYNADKATPEQTAELTQWARLQKAAERRGTSFTGKLTETLMTLPAFATEVAATSGVYSATEGAIFKGGGKALAEKFLKGQLSSVLEKGFTSSVLKKATASAVGAIPQGVLARGLSGVNAEVQENLQKSFDEKQLTEDADGNVHLTPKPGRDVPISIPGATYGALVRAYSDILSVHAAAGITKPFDAAIFQAVAGSGADATLTMAQDKLREMGINGFLGMMAQGEMAKGINALAGVSAYQPPSREDLAIAAISGAVPHALAGSVDFIRGKAEVRRAELHAEAFKRRGEMAAEVMKDAPDQKPEVLAALAKDGANDTTYVPIDVFKEHKFKDDAGNVLDPKEKAAQLGISEAQYHAAIASGQDLAVPSAAWDLEVGQHPEGRKFDPVLKNDPNDMSHEEALKYVKGIAADMAAEQRSKEAKARQPKESKVDESSYPTNEGKNVFKYSDTPSGLALEEAEQRFGGPASAFSDERARRSLPPEHADKIFRDLEEAHNKNVEAFTKKVMEESERRNGEEWAKKKESLKPEISKVVDALPAYKALSRLKDHANPDGSPLPEGTPTIKLSREALREMDIDPKILPRGTVDGEMIEGQHPDATGYGIHPDAAAQMLGYTDGYDLIQNLIDASDRYPREELIDRKAEAALEAKYGSLETDPERAKEEALGIVNRDYAGKIMKADRDWIFANKLSSAKGLLKEATRRPIPDQMVKDSVQKILQDMPAYQIDPRMAEAAERRAGREAESAIWKGDWETAVDAIQRRIVNHEFWNAATEAREFTVKTAGKLTDLGWKPSLNKPSNADYGQQLKALAERFGLRETNPKEMVGRKAFADWLTEKEQGEALETGLERIEIDPRLRDESYRPKFHEMTYGDIKSINDTIEQLKHVATEKSKSTLNGQRIEDDLIINQILDEIAAANPKELPKRGLVEKRGALKTADVFLMRPEEFLIRLVGDKVDGTLAEMTINRAGSAQGEMLDLRKEYKERMEKLRDSVPDGVAKRQRELINVPGLDTAVTRKAAIGMVLNGGNESNYTKMVEGEKLRSRERGLTEAQIVAVTNQLTREEVLYAQGIFDIHKDLWPKVAELQKRLKGIEPPAIEPKPVLPVLQREGAEGGYYHMMYDSTESPIGEIQVSKELGKLIQPSYKSATLNGGYRESRVADYASPVDFNIDRHTSFMTSMLQDLTHREFMIDGNKIANNGKIQAAIRDRFGVEYMNVFRDWLKRAVNDYARPSDQSVSAAGKWMGTLRANITNVAMGYRMSTALKHTITIEPCIDAIGKGDLAEGSRYFYRGLKDFFSHPFDNWKAIKEESSEMRHFHNTSEANVMDALTDLEGKDNWYSKAKRFGMYFATFGNILRAGATYSGAKQKALVDYAKAGHSGEQLSRYAIIEGERAVRLSIGSGAAKDIPAAMGRDNQAMRAITMFYTPGSMQLSRVMSTFSGFGRDRNMPRLLMRTLGWWIGGAVLHHLASGRVPDEEKDETWGGELGKALLEYPGGTVPLGSEITKSIVDHFAGEPHDFKYTPMAAPFNDSMKTLDLALKAAKDEGEWDEAVKQFIKTSGYYTGAPTGQLTDSGGYLYDIMQGNADPNDLGEFMHDVIFHHKKEK